MTSPRATAMRRACPGRVVTTIVSPLPSAAVRKNWLSLSPGTVPSARKPLATPVITGTVADRASVASVRVRASVAGSCDCWALPLISRVLPSVAGMASQAMMVLPLSLGGLPRASVGASHSQDRLAGIAPGATIAASTAAVINSRARPDFSPGEALSAMRSLPVIVARTMTGAASVRSARSACDSVAGGSVAGGGAACVAAAGSSAARIVANAAMNRGKGREKSMASIYAECAATAIDTKMSSSWAFAGMEMRYEPIAGNKRIIWAVPPSCRFFGTKLLRPHP